MANPNNNGTAIGRLARDPQIFANEDGSRTVYVTVAAQNNFISRDGSRHAEFVPLEVFIPADRGNGVYDLIHQGDLVAATYSVRVTEYNGDYKTRLTIDNVQMLEGKGTTSARLLQRYGQAQQVQQTQPAPVNQAPTQAQPEPMVPDELLSDSPFADPFAS